MTDLAHPSIATAAPLAPTDSDDRRLIDLWIDSHRSSAQTRRQYRHISGRLLAWMAQRPTDLRSLTLRDLLDFADTLTGLAPNTQKANLAAVKSLLTFAQESGYCRYNVGKGLEVGKAKNTLGERILSEEQVLAMITQEPSTKKKLLLRVLYSSGGRVSEICGLRWRDAVRREDAGQLTLLGKGGETRVVLLSKATWHALAAQMPKTPDPDAPIFATRTGKAVARSWVWDVVKAAAKRAGLPDGVSPHWMRHAHASHALDRGAPAHLVKETLGHASLETTSKYAHARPNESSSRFLPL